MKGTVAPPSSNVTVASTCSGRTPSSCAIFWLIFATRESLYPSTHHEPKPDRGTPLMDQPRLIHQGAARNRRQRIFLLKRCDLATIVGVWTGVPLASTKILTPSSLYGE